MRQRGKGPKDLRLHFPQLDFIRAEVLERDYEVALDRLMVPLAVDPVFVRGHEGVRIQDAHKGRRHRGRGTAGLRLQLRGSPHVVLEVDRLLRLLGLRQPDFGQAQRSRRLLVLVVLQSDFALLTTRRGWREWKLVLVLGAWP